MPREKNPQSTMTTNRYESEKVTRLNKIVGIVGAGLIIVAIVLGVFIGPVGLILSGSLALGALFVGWHIGLFDKNAQRPARVQESLNQEKLIESQVASPSYTPKVPSAMPVTQVYNQGFIMDSFLKLRSELIAQLKLFYRTVPRDSQNNLIPEKRKELENAWIYIGLTDPKVCLQSLDDGKRSREFIVPGKNILSNGIYKIIFDPNDADENTLQIQSISGKGIASKEWQGILQSAYSDITARNQFLANTSPSRLPISEAPSNAAGFICN